MKAKMLNQLVQRAKETLTKYEKKSGRDLGRDMWSTVYITDIPVQTLTDDVIVMIQNFILQHFDDKDVKDFTIERNGMLGFWEFTVITFVEVTEFDITEETDEERKARLMPIAEQWWEKLGSLDDKYSDDEWWIDDITEKDGGKTLLITMMCSVGVYLETLTLNERGQWVWENRQNE